MLSQRNRPNKWIWKGQSASGSFHPGPWKGGRCFLKTRPYFAPTHATHCAMTLAVRFSDAVLRADGRRSVQNGEQGRDSSERAVSTQLFHFSRGRGTQVLKDQASKFQGIRDLDSNDPGSNVSLCPQIVASEAQDVANETSQKQWSNPHRCGCVPFACRTHGVMFRAAN